MNKHFSEKYNSIQIAINNLCNENYFPRKPNTNNCLPIKIEDSPVQLYESQKHFVVILDKHLKVREHIKRKIKICN